MSREALYWQARVSDEEPRYRSGEEGTVFFFPEGKAVKFCKGVQTLYGEMLCILVDNLTEIKRKYKHDMHNALTDVQPITMDGSTVRFVDVQEAYIHGKESISVMEFVIAKLFPQTPGPTVEDIRDKLRVTGVVLDAKDDNVIVSRTGDIVVLEMRGGVSPDILKAVAEIDAGEQRDRILECLANVHLLDETMSYPHISSRIVREAPERNGLMSLTFIPALLQWSDIQRMWPLFEQKGWLDGDAPEDGEFQRWLQTDMLVTGKRFSEGAYDVDTHLKNSLWRAVLHFARELRERFGQNFSAELFDWSDDSTTVETYGVDEGVFHRFRQFVSQNKEEVDEIRKRAALEKEPTDEH